MHNTGKRIVSILLSVVMVLSVFGGMTFTASAAGDVATVTDGGVTTGYESFTDALSAWVDGSTLTLLRNVTTSSTISPAGTVELDLNGCGIKATASGFPVIKALEGVTLTISDSNPTGTTHYYSVASSSYATNVNDASGTYSFTGGYITGGNFSSDRGGALHIVDGTVHFTGGTMLGNRAGWGGAVYLGGSQGEMTMSGTAAMMYNYSSGQTWMNTGGIFVEHGAVLTMYGGSIHHNKAQYDAGGIYACDSGTVNLYGGSITNNICGQNNGGGGFAVGNNPDQPSVVNVAGSVVIADNTRGGTVANNLNMPAGNINLTGPLTAGAHIGVTVAVPTPAVGSPVAVTQNWSTYMGDADPNDYFFSDSDLYYLDVQNGEVYQNCITYDVTFASGEGSGNMAGVNTAPNYTLPSCTFTAPQGKLFSGWLSSANGSTYAAGANVSLTGDTTFTAQWTPSVTVTFDTAGGSAVAAQTILKNTSAVPGITSRSGFVFRGWMLNDEKYNFSEPVTEDITLTAVWIEGSDESTGFEDGLPEGWTIETNNSGYTWTVGVGDRQTTTGTHSGDSNLKITHKTTGNTAYLIMPEKDLSGVSTATLSFWYINRKWGSDIDTLAVCYRVNGGEWVEIESTNGVSHEEWTEWTIDLPAGAQTSGVQIAFKTVDGYGHGVGLDDISLSAGGHNLSYSASGSVLTATCSNDPCSFGGTLALTLNAPEKTLDCDDKSAEATLSGLSLFNLHTDQSLTASGIEYYSGSTKLSSAPTAPGNYTASYTATIGGTNYTITKDYVISLDRISVTITDGIGVNFYLYIDDPSREGVDSVTVTYKNFSGETVNETYAKDDLALQEDGSYKLTVWIAPAQLADEITVEIGDTVYNPSVLGYCESLKDNPEHSAFHPFANVLEQYAQAAKVAFNYPGAQIADISALTAADGFNSWQYQLSASPDMISKIGSISFLALTKPEFRFYTPDISEETAAACTVTASFKDGGAAGSLNARFAKNAQGDVLVEVTGVQAKDLGRTVVVTITGLGDTAQKIEFTGYDFAKIMVAQSNNADLGVALYNYGAAAADLVTAGIWA